MKLSFLIQFVLLFLLVLSLYLILTNKVQGRIKLIIIVFCVVLGLYLYSKINLFSNYNEFISTPINANESTSIVSKDLKKSNGKFTTSIWIFVEKWNTSYGQEKIILKRDGMIDIMLDKYKNDLIVKLYTENNINKYKSMLIDDTRYTISGDSIYNSVSDSNTISGDIINLDCSSNGTIYDKITNSLIDISCESEEEIVYDNIPLQKWVNIIVTIDDRIMDLYINGKLVKTKTFSTIISPTDFNENDIIIGDGTNYFGGYISKLRYYPHYITPQNAWDIYKNGFGDAFESALNQYNMSVSLYQDNVEKNKYFLF